jgi:hypothetical protein
MWWCGVRVAVDGCAYRYILMFSCVLPSLSHRSWYINISQAQSMHFSILAVV